MSFANLPLIPLAFFLAYALLLWVIIGISGNWVLKFSLIFLVAVVSFGAWKGLESFKGWATSQEIPEKSLLVGASVQEPDAKSGDPGAIYVLLIPYDSEGSDQKTASSWKVLPQQILQKARNTFAYHPKPGEPRNYRMPYTRKAHEDVEKALKSAMNGRPMLMVRNPKKGKAGGMPGQSDYGGSDEQDAEFVHYELPPSHVPSKDVQR